MNPCELDVRNEWLEKIAQAHYGKEKGSEAWKHPAKPSREGYGGKEKRAADIEAPPKEQPHPQRAPNRADSEPVAPTYLSKDGRGNLPARHGLSVRCTVCDGTGRHCIQIELRLRNCRNTPGLYQSMTVPPLKHDCAIVYRTLRLRYGDSKEGEHGSNC